MIRTTRCSSLSTNDHTITSGKRTWTGRHFLWLTSSYNNKWNSRFVGETPREEAWRKLFATMATLGIPTFRRQCSHSFIDLVAFWSLLCQKYQTLLELESSSCVTRASIQLAKDYKWAFQASLVSPNLRLTGSVANLPRSGRPKKLSMEARAFIDQQMRRNDETARRRDDETTSTKIRKKLAKRGILVSLSTVRRLQKQKIYYYSSIWWQWSEQTYVLSFLV